MYLELVFSFFREEVAQDVEVGAVFFEHQVEKFDLLRSPQFALFFALDGIGAGDRFGLTNAEGRFVFRFFLPCKTGTSNSMLSMRLRRVVLCFCGY